MGAGKMLAYENEIAKPKLGYKAILLSVEDLSDDTVRGKCHVSECYGKRYSCPPFAPAISYFQKDFRNIFAYLISMEGRDIKDWYFLANLTYAFGRRIEEYLNGISFKAGRCDLCETCGVELGEPCSKPKEMKYSFTGVGLHAGKLSELLDYKLWDEGHTSAVAGCLTNKETIEHEMLFRIFCQVASETTEDNKNDNKMSDYLRGLEFNNVGYDF